MMSLDIMSDVMSLKGMVDIISLARLRHIIRHTIAAEVCLTRPAARGKRGADTQPPATQALVIPSITRAQQTARQTPEQQIDGAAHNTYRRRICKLLRSIACTALLSTGP